MATKNISNGVSRRDVLQGMSVAVPATLAACGGGGQSPGFNSGTIRDPNVLDPPTPGARFEPRGLHVSLNDNAATTRGICWFTDTIENPGSQVEWGPVEAGMTDAEARDPVANPLPNLTAGSAEKTLGVEAVTHKAVLRDIDETKAVRYRVGSELGWSEVKIIKPTPASDQPWTFVHFGDHGRTHRSQALAQEINTATHAHDLLLIAGDISYADGVQERWDEWFDQNEDFLAEQVLMCAPGNHENKDKDVDDEDFTTIPTFAFNNRFNHPTDDGFYAFDYNRVHFFVFTAGALIEDGKLAQEMATLEADLSVAAARRAAGELDFIVVLQHYTIWTDQAGRAPGNGSLIAVEEQILARYGVDVVLAGHDHVYQRSKRMYAGQEDQTGAGYVQLMVGCGGQSIRLFEPTISSWSEEEFIGVGFLRVEVDGGTMACQFFGSPPTEMETRENITGNFDLVDEFTIEKRGTTVAAQYALPPRPNSEILADFPAVLAHTRALNAAIDREHDHGHG